jgi:hypothetical protein
MRMMIDDRWSHDDNDTANEELQRIFKTFFCVQVYRRCVEAELGEHRGDTRHRLQILGTSLPRNFSWVRVRLPLFSFFSTSFKHLQESLPPIRGDVQRTLEHAWVAVVRSI